MFKINKQQMAVFAELSVRSFEERMIRYLGERFPKHCATLAAIGLQSLARKGIERATSHGITIEKDVSRFIGLMCVFGEGFDADPKLPWAAEVLGKEGPKSTSEKVAQLCKKASEHLVQMIENTEEDALAVEASSALAEERPNVGAWEPFSRDVVVGQPIVPCLKVVRKRLYAFSS